MQRILERVSAIWAEESRAAVALVRRLHAETWLLVLLFVAAICLWVILGEAYPAAVFASPYETGEALSFMLSDYRHDYSISISDTLVVFSAGYCGSILAAILIALVMNLFPLAGRTVNPCLDLLASVPNIAFMPIVVALMGLGHSAKITVVFLASVLPMTINAHAALRQVDRSYEEAALTLGARRLQAHLRVIWPMAAPQIVAGMRTGAVQGLAACVIAEIYTAMTGLGGLLVGYSNAFNMPRYFVIVLTLALIGILITAVLRRIERHFAKRIGLVTKEN